MAQRRSKIEDQIGEFQEAEDIPGLDVYCLKGTRKVDPEPKGTEAFNLYVDFDGPVCIQLELFSSSFPISIQAGTPYAGGHFHTCWCYPADYFTDPKKGPTITFTHKVYHPSGMFFLYSALPQPYVFSSLIPQSRRTAHTSVPLVCNQTMEVLLLKVLTVCHQIHSRYCNLYYPIFIH